MATTTTTPNARESNNRERRVPARWVRGRCRGVFPRRREERCACRSTHFRERARRELARHKAPVFALPSDLRFCEGTRDKRARASWWPEKNARQTALFRGKRGGASRGPQHRVDEPQPTRAHRRGHRTSSVDLAEIDRGTYLRTPRGKRARKNPRRSRSPPGFSARRRFPSSTFVRRSPRVATRSRHARPARRFRFGFFTRRRDFGHHHACIDKPRMEPCLGVRAKTPPGLLSFPPRWRRSRRRRATKTSALRGDVLGARRARDAKVSRENARLEARDEARATRNARGRTHASADGQPANGTRGGGSRRARRGPGLRRRKPLFCKTRPSAGFARGPNWRERRGGY